MAFAEKLVAWLMSAVTMLMTMVGLVPTEYDNPIDYENGGDPCIVEDETGTYYTFTTGMGVEIRKIASYDDATVLETKTVWQEKNNDVLGWIWAPEIHKIGDRWYIIACGVFDENVTPRGTMPLDEEYEEGNQDYYRYAFVLESKTEDIMGEYEFKGRLAPDGLNNIDGTYLKKDGKLYYVCSAYLDTGYQGIYICEMENPYTLKTDENGRNNAVQLSAPELYWEKKGWRVNEGPSALYNGDDTYIVYSASGFSSGGYCLGMLTLCGDDVMNADDWSKSLTRVLYHQPFKNIYNAGHCSFLYRENGEIFMVYHATQTKDFSKSPRVTFIKPVVFDENGKPSFW